MPHFAVTRRPGPAWDGARSMREQDRWDDHAAFMDALAAERFIVAGGPLGDGTRFLFLVTAAGEDDIRTRLDADPWTGMGLLTVASIVPWRILLGDVG